ncbi:MAG: TraR/DksA family transcriptional regulator [Myxococcales bacterium]|nr:TraR/DksA family transcriptional regulator [Myxococcales bacterium]
MSYLNQDELDRFEQRLISLRDELERLLEASKSETAPVDLDQPIGRLTRMDAIQQQKMAEASRRRNEIRLKQISAALGALRKGDYGYCVRCEDEIGNERLEARPESPLCLDCQNELEAGG